MPDPFILLLFVATWGGIAWIFRRLTDDLRRNTVRQSGEPGTAIASDAANASEEMVRFTAELQQTVDELGDALTRRADRLKELIAEADRRIESLSAAPAAPVALRVQAAPTPVQEPVLAAPVAEPESIEPAPAPQPYETAIALPRSEGRAPAEEVRRLAAQGLDADTIARLTNRGREEVRLLIARSATR